MKKSTALNSNLGADSNKQSPNNGLTREKHLNSHVALVLIQQQTNLEIFVLLILW